MSGSTSKRGNGVVGLLREEHNKWERRAPLTPSHCARLLHADHDNDGVERILVQPCTKRIHTDAQYQDVGCELAEDLSECGLVLGVKRPKCGTLLEDRAYAFFSHTHKAQPENLPLLDEVLEKRVSLYDYELIMGEHGERLVAFGEYAGFAGMIDFLRGLGERYLSLGFSTPFLSLGSSYMYSTLTAARSAVLAIGDEIARDGLPLGICPLIFVFTGTGNVSHGAQEIFRLLPHQFVDPSELPRLAESSPPHADYYAHPEQYHSVFHNTIALYASVIVNCMYWERRFPRLLTNMQLQELTSKVEPRLLGVADITCDVRGSIECLHQITPIESPFFRYNPESGTYHKDMDGDGIIVLAVDCLPAELAKESTKHFGDVLYPFLSSMAYASTPEDTLVPVKKACIAHNGKLTPLYDYIQRMRQSDVKEMQSPAKLNGKKSGQFTRLISLNGHLFDQFLINEALDVICDAGGRFHLATCKLGQSDEEISHADLEVEADSEEELANIVDALAAIATHTDDLSTSRQVNSVGKSSPNKALEIKTTCTTSQSGGNLEPKGGLQVLILGAGRMCEPAITYLALHGRQFVARKSPAVNGPSDARVWVVVASLFLEDAQKAIAGIPNATAMQLDSSNNTELRNAISRAMVVISLLPADCHVPVAVACIELKKHLVTASYVSPEMAALHKRAKDAGVSLLCEMGLDPGIDHMMAMKMIDLAHLRGGRVQSFVSFCGGLPAPTAANNPLGYKFSWNPSGAIKAGRNPAVYLYGGDKIEVAGEDLFSSAVPVRLRNLPAFALERLPNRDSLKYGDLYGIANEASTIFRATLRYEGFSEVMAALGELGFFNTEPHPMLDWPKDASGSGQPTYKAVLEALLCQLSEQKMQSTAAGTPTQRNDTSLRCAITEKLASLGCCKDPSVALRAANCIRWLGLDVKEDVPEACKSPFDILCHRMEERLTYAANEQDMVVLHHELKVVYDDGRLSERHTATLLALGETCECGMTSPVRPQSAMARTVGLPAAIAAQLLLFGEVKSRGVLRPLAAEVYGPALEIMAALGVQLEEHVENF